MDQSFDAETINYAHDKGLGGRAGDSPHTWRLLSDAELLEQASRAAKDLARSRPDYVPSILPKKRKFVASAEHVEASRSPIPNDLVSWDEDKIGSHDSDDCFEASIVSASALIGESSAANSFLLHDRSTSRLGTKKDTGARRLLFKKRKMHPDLISSYNDDRTSKKTNDKAPTTGNKSKGSANIKNCHHSTAVGRSSQALGGQRRLPLQRQQEVCIPSEGPNAPSSNPSSQDLSNRDFYSATMADADDAKHLAPLQCELRKHLEIFEANQDDVNGSRRPGRKGLIAIGQVGIRCVYCARMNPASRTVGGVYYSHTVSGIYQIAQNMMNLHLIKRCVHTPKEAKYRLKELQSLGHRSRGKNTAKYHWQESLEKRGIYELQDESGGKRLVRGTLLASV